MAKSEGQTFTCRFCGKVRHRSPSRRRLYCDNYCHHQHRSQRIRKPCEDCGTLDINPDTSRRAERGRVLCRDCWKGRVAAYRRQCSFCRNTVNHWGSVFCSQECRYKNERQNKIRKLHYAGLSWTASRLAIDAKLAISRLQVAQKRRRREWKATQSGPRC